MKTIWDDGKHYCVVLERNADDLELLSQAKLICYQEKRDFGDVDVPDPQSYLDAMYRDPLYWNKALQSLGRTEFLIFEKDEDGDNFIGMASSFNGSGANIVFSNMHILHDHRGQGHAGKLYEALMLHTVAQTNIANAFLGIKPNNPDSQRAAHKSGFQPIYTQSTREVTQLLGTGHEKDIVWHRNLLDVRKEIKYGTPLSPPVCSPT